MTAHRRTEIRSLITQRLRAANTRAAERIYPGRLQPANEDELWAGGVVFVYTGEERTGRDGAPDDGYPPSNSRAGLRRQLNIDIQAIASAFSDTTPETADFVSDAFTDIDALTREIEDALETFDLPGFESSILRLRSSEPELGSATEGGLPTSKCLMRYELTYTTPYRACSDPLVDNDSADIRLRGLYPGGQVVEGCPAGNIGETCPLPPPEGNVEPILDSLGVYLPSVT